MESDHLPVEENLEEIVGDSPTPSDAEQLVEPIEQQSNPSQYVVNSDISDGSDISIDNDATPDEPITSESISEKSPESLGDLANGEISSDHASPELSTQVVEQLKQEEIQLRAELDQLKTAKSKILQDQIDDLQAGIIRLAQADVARLEYQKQELQAAIAVLEKRKERLEKEMTTTYAGASQDIAVRVQGFKEYLVGSLQDLVASAEKLNLIAPESKTEEPVIIADSKPTQAPEPPLLSGQTFAEYKQRVDQLLDRYRTLPDYYGAAWKLRRTFEQVHADRVSKWFFEQSGRGAIRTMGTRLQNILVTSAAISILKAVYGEKMRVLVLATSPERLGEWRRGFQDCLGLTREHFGSDKGIALFEDPEPLATKGDRLVKEQLMPLVVIDESEELIAVDLLRFPLLIAFGGAPETKTSAPSTYINRDNNRDNVREPNRDFSREPNRDPSKDYSREPNRDYPNRDYGSNRDYGNNRNVGNNRDYPSRDYGSNNRDYGYGGNRGRGSNSDSDWDW